MSSKVEVQNDSKKVTKFDLFIAWLRWCLVVEVPVSFDRMQALGFCYSINKILRKVYKDQPEELQQAMRRHARMFNTNADWGSVIHGIIISLEEQRARGNKDVSEEMMESLKIGLMGPLAGIGDSVDQGIVMTIPLAIFVPMALNGSIFAAFVPSLIYMAWAYGFSWFLFNRGYNLGKNSVLSILQSGAIKKVIDIASIVGLFMIGCLSAAYVKFETILSYSSEAETVQVQELIDNMIPNLLPFALVMGIYYFIIKKGPKYLQIILFVMVFAILLTLIGVI
ncbi:PTS system mannose/fructose/sorbose family transporter subunit IID [Marinilactibacillus psychrotolerans]|uniref:Mannose-specific PTS system IID component n=1 Tax=Marinilactibacillus psychrotolerans TaxID=191770 RepID=A0AAV3WPF1_9LACT|nr:PTS system mannose/fructose/sorbose family transporter subunit IID [Marinilactibacillus psychrotolerans]GEL67607.1 PTS fructose transporter subunit IID [Marinilactibacillus psychrotolerans]GEQ35509.1 mannose-specific PTS system IID component [Marinilactibacillus psychrotolerans]SDD07703.1 PTS system, mannose-specific IID component [Marinilactibacillus psychrotolerans]